MTQLDEFMEEINAYDCKWFEEIGGIESLAEIRKMRHAITEATKLLTIGLANTSTKGASCLWINQSERAKVERIYDLLLAVNQES